MYRSYWDVEVYAKDFQDRRRQEAAMRRLSDEAARSASRDGSNPFNLGIARFLASVKSWFSSGRLAAAPHTDHGLTGTASEQLEAGHQSQISAPRAKSGHLAQPYADMVVIARRPAVAVAEQPCGVSDC